MTIGGITLDNGLQQRLSAGLDRTPGANRALETPLAEGKRRALMTENLDVFDFELTLADLAAINSLETGKRGGPNPDDITIENFSREIPDA